MKIFNEVNIVKKRILALLLVFAMVLSATPSYAIAAEEGSTVSVGTAEDLAAALAAGGTVALSGDIALSAMIEVPSGVTVTLDLNGHNITVAWADEANGKHIYALNNKGNLTLKDSIGTGSIAARGIYNGYDGSNTANTVEGAKLTVLSGKYIALDTSGDAAIFNCAELIIKNGTFEGQVAAVNGREKSNTIIHNGTFRSVSNYAIQNNGGQMTIHNATVDAGFGAVGCFGGTTTIVNGTYLPTGRTANTCHVVYVAGAATVDIQGGTFKMNYPADAVPDSGSAVASYYNGTLTISGGTFTSLFDNISPIELSNGSKVTGGTYLTHSGNPSNHTYVKTFIAENYTLTNGVVALDSSIVAKVNGTYYKSLQAAFDEAQKDDIVTLCTDVELDATLTIPAGKIITLELNGKKLSGVSSAAAASAVILNKGSLTIQDGVGNGRITSEALNPDLNWGGEGEPSYPTYANNTIRNEGVLKLLSGTIESTTAAGGASYAIDNYSNGVITIEEGTVVHKNGIAIRLYASSATNENSLTINGGAVTGGSRAVWIQLPSNNASVGPKATLKVTGGTLTSNDTTYNLAVYFYSFGNNAANTDIAISGGTFNGDIAFYGTTLTEDNVSITGGTFNGAYGVRDYYGELVDPIITGGSYQYVYTDYIAEGYDAVLVDDYYIVHMHDSLTDIPAVDATCTETGLTAGKKCSVCGTVMSGVAEIPASEHSWSTDFQPGTDTHWQYCMNDCGTKQNEAAHTFVEKVDNVYIVADSVNDCAVEYVKSCSVCGKGHATETFWAKKEAPEHTYNAGLVTTEPTCTAPGVKTYTCINEHCGHTKTETIPAKDHTEVEITGKNATCTETGLTAGKKCSTCGTVTVAQIVIGKKAHTEVDLPAKEATCTETGLTAGKQCSVCAIITVEQTVVDKKAHTLDKVAANAATYFASGNIEHYACTVCGALFADGEGAKEVTLADVTLAQLVKIEDTTADVSTDVVEDVIKEATSTGTTNIVITVTQDKLAEDNKEETPDTEPDEDESTDTPEPPATEPAPVVTKTQLPVAAVQQVADLHEEATLTVNMTNATVTMDKATLDVVTEKAKTEQTDVIALEIEHIKTESLAPVQQVAVEEKTVAAVISASILVNDKEVHDFEGGKVTVTIPFVLEAGTTASDYIVLYVADDGTVEEIPSAYADGKLVMTLSHFSEYVVVNTAAPKDPTNPGTGDNFDMAMMVFLMVTSATAIVTLSNKKRFVK